LASKDHIISLIDGKPYKALRRGRHNASARRGRAKKRV
jgi:predicted transcriptional regulator